MASPRERDQRDHRWDPSPGPLTRRPRDPGPGPMYTPPVWQRPGRRHHFHDVPPWPHQRYRDYIAVENWGWWPRWFPYWDPSWRAYWWSLYDYYGGDASSDYAEYARDAVLRSNAPQWGLVVSGDYGGAQVGIQPYGLTAPATRSSRNYDRPDQIAAYRRTALDAARRVNAATGGLLFGYRDSPWGSELTAFGTLAGLQRWANEQGTDSDVWYAAAFDMGSNRYHVPFFEVAR